MRIHFRKDITFCCIIVSVDDTKVKEIFNKGKESVQNTTKKMTDEKKPAGIKETIKTLLRFDEK